MNKLLVTTDLSDKSKAGLLFAIQLATQNKCSLTSALKNSDQLKAIETAVKKLLPPILILI